jgi:hypothetical protein
MGLVLRSGISFCDAGGRLLFLDVVADRYFCLADATERAFRSMTDGRDHPDRDALAGLLRSGMLIETADATTPIPFGAVCAPTASLLDAQLPRCGVLPRAAALSTLALTRLSLRRSTLHAILRRLAETKTASSKAEVSASNAIEEVAAAFAWTARIVRSHDQCLSRSIAVARRLAALGLAGDLVIGVRLRPFAAHSWVQADGRLVNDRIDTVRTYTPILAV